MNILTKRLLLAYVVGSALAAPFVYLALVALGRPAVGFWRLLLAFLSVGMANDIFVACIAQARKRTRGQPMTAILLIIGGVFALIGAAVVTTAFLSAARAVVLDDGDPLHAPCRREIDRLTAELAQQYHQSEARARRLVAQGGDDWAERGIGAGHEAWARNLARDLCDPRAWPPEPAMDAAAPTIRSDDLILRARTALAAATPGPWKASEMTHYGKPGTGFWYISPLHGESEAYFEEPDAYLIAHAPTWLAELCDRLEMAGIGVAAPTIVEGAVSFGDHIQIERTEPDWRCSLPDCERRVWAGARGGREA